MFFFDVSSIDNVGFRQLARKPVFFAKIRSSQKRQVSTGAPLVESVVGSGVLSLNQSLFAVAKVFTTAATALKPTVRSTDTSVELPSSS